MQELKESLLSLLKNRLLVATTVLALGVLLFLVLLLSNSKEQGDERDPTDPKTPAKTNQGRAKTSLSPTPTLIPLKEQVRLQTRGDREVADYWRNVSSTYPWYKKLPLQNESYFVYFDLSKKAFIADLYPRVNETVESVQKEVQEHLRSLAIPLEGASIIWYLRGKEL